MKQYATPDIIAGALGILLTAKAITTSCAHFIEGIKKVPEKISDFVPRLTGNSHFEDCVLAFKYAKLSDLKHAIDGQISIGNTAGNSLFSKHS